MNYFNLLSKFFEKNGFKKMCISLNRALKCFPGLQSFLCCTINSARIYKMQILDKSKIKE